MNEDFIANRLAELREQRGVSAREMSLALGQNASYINRIENKKALPSMQVFLYICEYLKITPQDFFNGTNRDPLATSQIVSLLPRLDPTQLDLLKRLIDQMIRD